MPSPASDRRGSTGLPEEKPAMTMAADVTSVAKLLRGEAGKKGGPEIVTMDLLGGCGGGGGRGAVAAEDEEVDLEVKVPAGWERRLDLLSGKTFLTPRHPTTVQPQGAHQQDLNLPPPAAAAAVPAASPAVCTLDMVRSALDRAAARWTAAAPSASSTSSASTSSTSSAGKRHRSPPTVVSSPAAMRLAPCTSCLHFLLIVEADPRCPRCGERVQPLDCSAKPAVAGARSGSGKKPRIDLNAAADETE